MKYTYNSLAFPPLGERGLQRLDQAAERLAESLTKLDPHTIDLSDDGMADLERVKQDIGGVLRKYVHLLAWALYPEMDIKSMVLVDYGGGLGLLSCLGRLAGASIVIYNDIFAPCCKDAQVLAKAMGCEADAYVCGDVHQVNRALEELRERPCALISINVIEHIYDMDEFLEVASGLSRGQMTLVLSTSANPLNPLVARRHFAQHREWEFEDGPHESCGAMDTLRAFYDVRRDIIHEAAPTLGENELDKLSRATRGLRKDDILAAVCEYQRTGKIAVTPEHPTNTCDPLTGNWQERLLDIPTVRNMLSSRSFSVRVSGGYYGAFALNPLKRAMKKGVAVFLNWLISAMGPQGARLSPCITFYATRQPLPARIPAAPTFSPGGGGRPGPPGETAPESTPPMRLANTPALPDQDHYSILTDYLRGNRIHSYAHQLKTIIQCSPSRVLEVGKGPGMVAAALRVIGIKVVVLDMQPELEPDLVGSVTAIPAPDGEFDATLCCQVLEHLPFAQFVPALRELRRVTRSTLIMSLPDVTPYYCIKAKLPLFPKLKWEFSRPRLGLPKIPAERYEQDGHYWEIGYQGTSLPDVNGAILSTPWRIARNWRVPEMPWHRFYLLKKD